jgi:hypothetical protein
MITHPPTYPIKWNAMPIGTHLSDIQFFIPSINSHIIPIKKMKCNTSSGSLGTHISIQQLSDIQFFHPIIHHQPTPMSEKRPTLTWGCDQTRQRREKRCPQYRVLAYFRVCNGLSTFQTLQNFLFFIFFLSKKKKKNFHFFIFVSCPWKMDVLCTMSSICDLLNWFHHPDSIWYFIVSTVFLLEVILKNIPGLCACCLLNPF